MRKDELAPLLDLSTDVDLRAEKVIGLKIDLPEFSLETCFEGCQVQVDAVSRADREFYFRATVGDLAPADGLRPLIMPGLLVKSTKGWTDLKRR